MSTTLLISIISTAVVYAATVLYAAVGEIFSQRAGIMNLGLEGIMLMGAVSGYMVAVYRQNLVLAMLVVILVGAALGLVFSFLTVTMQAYYLNGTVHIGLVGNERLTEVVSLTALLQNLCLEEGEGRVIPARTASVLVLDGGDGILLNHREHGFVAFDGVFVLRLCAYRHKGE